MRKVVNTKIVIAWILPILCICNGHGMSNKKIIDLLLSEPDKELDVLSCEKDWEWQFDYATILEIDDKYVMYYRAVNFKRFPYQTYCRVTSLDGIHWERENVCKFNYEGSTDNNIITDRIDGVSVAYVDGIYWLIADRRWDENNKLVRGMLMFKSTDGVNFEQYDNFKVPYYCDSQNEILWDKTSKTFKIYLRSWYKCQNPMIDYHHTHKCYRSVSLLEIPNLDYTMPLNPSAFYLTGKTEPPSICEELSVVLQNMSLSEDFDIYCAYVNKYRKSLYIAYPINYYHTDDKSRGGKLDNDGYGTIGFWTSKDGRVFKEVKRDYITNGNKWIESCVGHVETKDMFIHYYIPFNNTHEERALKNTIRARIHYKNKKWKNR